MYFFVFRSLHIGGVETLILRECDWYKKRGGICVICQHISGIEKKEFEQHDIQYIQLKKWNSREIFNCINNVSSKIDYIKFYHFKDFIEFDFKYHRKRIKYLYYCVHPRNMFYFQTLPKLKQRFGCVFSELIENYIDSRNIIFMNEDVINSTLDYYGIIQYKDKCSIILLPFKIQQYDYKKRNKGKLRILTVARADFPYKGYVLGLIDDLANNFNDLSDFELTIISAGDDILELKSKIDSIEKRIQKQIVLIEGVYPEELDDFYSSADVYIGMGTTVLEATNFGVPSIVAQYDTRDFCTKGFFYENPMDLGSKYTDEHKGIIELTEIYKTSDDEYKSIQIKSLQALNENYDEELIFKEFDSWECLYDTKRIGLLKRLFVKTYFKLIDWRFS